jgi:hypothetical protein
MMARKTSVMSQVHEQNHAQARENWLWLFDMVWGTGAAVSITWDATDNDNYPGLLTLRLDDAIGDTVIDSDNVDLCSETLDPCEVMTTKAQIKAAFTK